MTQNRYTAELDGVTSSSYRSDIDGLRAVSIIAVVGYHAFPWLVPGGFVGVDIFFVISGFLITQIILGRLAKNSFSILDFYRRRIRRIFPALIAVSAATYIAGWIILLPRDFKLLGENMVGGAGFFSNFVQLNGEGYFAPDASSNPLLHLWSLGIEEQFYVFWPILLIFLNGKRWNAIVIAIALGSMAANLFLIRDHEAIAFYSPVTRAWELLAGALLARAALTGVSYFGGVPDEIKGATGLLLIALAGGLIEDTSKYPGWAALVPVAAAVLLLDAPGSTTNRRLLSYPAMVFIGRVSYPLYLWHWPLLCYLAIVRGGVPNVLEKVLAVCLAFALACGTYYFVEKPIRQRRTTGLGLISAMISVGVVGLLTVLNAGFDFRFPADVTDIANLPVKGNSGFRSDCFFEAREVSSEWRKRCIEGGSGPVLFVWGDSTAAALYPGLKAAQHHYSFRIAQFTSAACSPIVGASGHPQCAKLNDEAMAVIADTRPEIVFLHAMWNEKTDFQGLRKTISVLKGAGIPRIVILGPAPVWKRSLPFSLVNSYRFEHQLPDRIATGVSGPAVDDIMAQFSKDAGVEFLSAWRRFCNSDGCKTRVGPAAEDVIVWDQVHLSNKGSEFLGEAITDYLFGRQM
jgi:peptidoglycan/LPS O-acetylase OafA/YrhL